MQFIEAHYDIVTPMFIGGGDSQDSPELRPPSIKGALRFWWRALQWGTCLSQHSGDAGAALTTLHQQEAHLFGAAAIDDKYGQGKVLLKIKVANDLKSNPEYSPTPGQVYLLGQGLYNFKQGILKNAIAPKQTFKVILKLHNDVEATSIINALLLFGLLGGLGSRARKGWGSIAIRSLVHTDKVGQVNVLPIPDNKNSYQQTIAQILGTLPADLPPFSAFSQGSRIDISSQSESDNALALLTNIGDEMQRYRSYGKANHNGVHTVNNHIAEQNFKGDHDLVLDFANGIAVQQHPKRVVFGLPHNYFYSNGTKVDVDAAKFSRRASPLIIHIHQFSSGQCMAIQSLIKADFLPEHEKIQLKKGHNTRSIECDIDWTVITDYLERFNQREQII
jgi:CRISPR-associated protein Cmr1